MTNEETHVQRYLEMLANVCRQNIGQENKARFHYLGGPAEFLLTHGIWFKPPSNITLYPHAKMKACFRNAAVYALAHQRRGIRYVEGYAAGIIPVHHAWCVDSKNRVLEVTWSEYVPRTVYFGIEFDPMKIKDGSVLFNEHNINLYRKPYAK